MTEDQFKNLQRGDIVRHVTSPDSVVVTGNFGNRVSAIRAYDLTNPNEWRLIGKANHERVEE
jgi:hypothetical protein